MWDVRVPDTFAPSHLPNTSLTAGAAADKAVISKTAKYNKLRGTHLFFPVTIVTSDPLETQYLFQRIFITIQRGNAVAFQNTFPTERSCSKIT